ncbi:MAG TPA: hypothetical protein VMT75_05220 [Candidatus Saccharimonadales bacterium]|nr:hypothetical protein [Candidatus Saccharimonadales bacterium]
MNRILRALTVVLLFEMGALLLYLPWSAFWEQNYFLSHYPWLMPLFLHPAIRGIVSGIGVLDIFVAFGLFNTRSATVSVPPSTNS